MYPTPNPVTGFEQESSWKALQKGSRSSKISGSSLRIGTSAPSSLRLKNHSSLSPTFEYQSRTPLSFFRLLRLPLHEMPPARLQFRLLVREIHGNPSVVSQPRHGNKQALYRLLQHLPIQEGQCRP